MTEPNTIPAPGSVMGRLRDLATRSRGTVELNWAREREEQLARDRQEAMASAASYVRNHFPATLAMVLPDTAWAGYPRLGEAETESLSVVRPCAVAHLGEGVWIHHTRSRSVGHHSTATLLIPCVCGNYREAPVDDDYTLARELDYLADTCDVCLGACTPSCPTANGEDW
ncbi:hypothetical protein [Streptomyces tirandamycinicus]|uniref:4Fe-4S ferredoxin-type domain-containing protein n=1 Tax=Streptomyces tirandamycinicus TaxID=2174846 RepID=A0A2S1SVJ1_9ACTN|nr:hypothetical protein [Streptomyces tirandamycinicus]AWI30421.1 hypothetical protein DDW44_17780 [Streptomyces tirandamycinicus]